MIGIGILERSNNLHRVTRVVSITSVAIRSCASILIVVNNISSGAFWPNVVANPTRSWVDITEMMMPIVVIGLLTIFSPVGWQEYSF